MVKEFLEVANAFFSSKDLGDYAISALYFLVDNMGEVVRVRVSSGKFAL